LTNFQSSGRSIKLFFHPSRHRFPPKHRKIGQPDQRIDRKRRVRIRRRLFGRVRFRCLRSERLDVSAALLLDRGQVHRDLLRGFDSRTFRARGKTRGGNLQSADGGENSRKNQRQHGQVGCLSFFYSNDFLFNRFKT